MFARVHQKSHPHTKKFFEMLLNCGWRFSDDSLRSGYWGSFCSQVCFGCVGKCATWEQWYSMGWALLQSQQQIRRGELTCSPSRTHFLQPAVLAKTPSGFFFPLFFLCRTLIFLPFDCFWLSLLLLFTILKEQLGYLPWDRLACNMLI